MNCAFIACTGSSSPYSYLIVFHLTSRRTHEELKDRVSPKILGRVTEFWDCSGCGKVVWKGNQYKRAQNMFEELYGHQLEHELDQEDLNDIMEDLDNDE